MLGAIDEARRAGAATVGLACNRPSLLGGRVDLEIAPLVGPEVVAGSTRLKAGTATKLILNMITTGAMIRIGKTLGNRMIDLMPTNEKLRLRSRRILRELTGPGRRARRRSAGPLGRPSEAGPGGGAGRGRPRPGAGAARRARRPGARRDRGGDRRGAAMTAPARLGIDGGGTSTVAWLADDAGNVLGRGRSGPSNAKTVGAPAARAALAEAIGLAFADAGLRPATVGAACLGLAGFDRPDDRRLLEAWNAELGWARRLVLVNDGALVIAAGTPEGWGLGVIAGTGSIAVGRASDGTTARAGGWGPSSATRGAPTPWRWPGCGWCAPRRRPRPGPRRPRRARRSSLRVAGHRRHLGPRRGGLRRRASIGRASPRWRRRSSPRRATMPR